MYYVCECGAKFNDEKEGASEHMLEQHLDLIESRFVDFLDDAIDNEQEFKEEDLYEDAVEDTVDEMLDEFEGE
jgi:hypothetical protein